MAEFARRGVMLVLASPSGAGKSSISRALFEQDPNISPVGVGDDARAPHRRDRGHALSFHRRARRSSACAPTANCSKSAEVHGNFYGTPRAHVEEKLAAGRDILFDIDYQGTLQLYEKCRADMVTVFILPPSIRELRKRLERRAQDSKAPSRRG